MVSKRITVIGDSLRSKNASNFVDFASKFNSSVYVEVENKRINAKSIIGLLSLNLHDGDEICVFANGADETFALKQIEEYLG